MVSTYGAVAVAARAVFAAAAVLQTWGVQAAPLTLDEAWRIAEERNPALRGAQAGVHAAQGQMAESRAPLWNNPSVSLEQARTRIPRAEERYRGWTFGLSQTFELGGQQARRRDAAAAELESVETNIAEVRRELRAVVEQRFVQVLALQLRAAVERETVALVERADAAMRKRFEAGEVSKLDGNLARVEAERARNQLSQLDEQTTQARAELAALLQLPPAELPEVGGSLRREAGYTREQLLSAAARRKKLASLERREEAARNRLALERGARTPDVSVGITAGRDGPPELRERIAGLAISVPIPVFRRNEAGVGRALGELTQAQIERQAAERDTLAEVHAQWQRVALLEARARRHREAVLRVLEENQRLSQTALREGEISISELLLVNRQVGEVRRELLEAETELRLARVALEKAAGWPPLESKEAK